MSDVIRSRGLCRAFGKVQAVVDLDLQVPEGQLSAFLGPNGAGKTTAIRLLLGLLRPSAGEVEVLGRPAGHREALARTGAMVEAPSLYNHLTGRENLEITRLMRDCPRSEVDRVLGLVGLSSSAHRLVKGYSLGMRQRLGLALALLGEPALILLDEPTNGLDPSGIQEIRELLRALPKQSGTSVFVSSHLLAEVEQMADHLVVIHRGTLRYQGALADFGGEEARLKIVVDDAQRALTLLRAEGLNVEAEGAGLLVRASLEEAPRVARRLVQEGLGLFELSPGRRSLEARFLSLVEGA